MPVVMQVAAILAFMVGMCLLSVGKRQGGVTSLLIMWVIVIVSSLAQPGAFL